MKSKTRHSYVNAIGVGCAAWLALACGSNNDDAPATTPAPLPVVLPPPDPCEGDNPYLLQCQPPAPPPDVTGPGAPPVEPPALGEKEQVENILLANCGGCHGTQLTAATAEAQMNYINDIDELARNGKIVPLDSIASPIIRKMRDGSMPPPDRGQRVPNAQIDVVANFIDDRDNWDLPPTVCDNAAVSFDQIYKEVARDLRDAESEDREFLRYVSLANRTTAGVCADTALDRDRHALTKMLNMLSISSSIEVPGVVDPKSTLYRVDLRDFDWNRAITVAGVPFDDVWEAIVDANPYAVPFVGDEADDARADALTDVPVMFLDSMLETAIVGNLYYAIIGVDVDQTIDAFILDELGIDVAANLENEDLIRAGTTKSTVSRQDRVIEGHKIERRPGVFYQSFDFLNVQNESIFQDPFGFDEGGREAIFTLPNGMLAYLIADAEGNLVEDSDILLDTQQDNRRALTAVSCSSCHAAGLISVEDEVRESVIANSRALLLDGALSQEQFEQLREVYLPPDEFAARLADESELFYLAALEQANLPLRGPEPVSGAFVRFNRDMRLADAAGDLGLSSQELGRFLTLLEPELGILAVGTLDRDDFTKFYVASLCTLSGVLSNQPDEAVCDAALAALEE